MNQPSTKAASINDILRLALPLNTQTMGATAVDRLVKWVVLLTSFAKFDDQVQADDLVILPVVLQEKASRSEMARFLNSMSRLSVAGLLLLQPLAQEHQKLAKELDLAALVMPEKTDLRETHQSIASLLIDRQSQVTQRSMQLYRRLSEMSREGQGLAAMAGVMAKLTGKVVVVQDKRLEIQAITIPGGSPFAEGVLREVLCQRENLPDELRNRKAVVKSQKSHWQQFITVNERRLGRLVSPIISGDRARGYLSIVGQPDELDLLDRLTSEHGAAACALEMARAKAISEAKKALRGDFLEGLLAGTLPEEEIERLAGRLDHKTKQRHAIMTFAWDGEEPPSLRRLETALNWLLSSHDRPTLTHVYSNSHVCVFQALENSDADMNSALRLAGRLREHLRAESPEVHLLAGLSGPARTLAEWPDVYRQALQAMQLSQRLKLDEVVEYNSLVIYQLLIQLDELPAVHQFRDKAIGPLIEYDRSHRSSLVKTIDAFFKYHGNISQTAESLYIHRNTLLYRLERIQELTGYDLDQSDTRLALHLALKLWHLRADKAG